MAGLSATVVLADGVARLSTLKSDLSLSTSSTEYCATEVSSSDSAKIASKSSLAVDMIFLACLGVAPAEVPEIK